MDNRSRHPQTWSSRRRRDDVEKRGGNTKEGSEFDEMEAFVHKKKRQLGDLKEESERLRSERNKLRAELARKSCAVTQLEQQLKDERMSAIKRCKTILDDAFANLDAPPATNGSTVKGDSEEDDSDLSEEGAGDVDAPPAHPAGPGDAARGPSDEREEEKAEAACEPAVPPNDMVNQAALGGQ